MGRRLTDLTFEEWVTHTFGYPVTEASPRRPIDADRWRGSAAIAVGYLTRAFENAAEVLAPYSDVQLADGFWGLGLSPLTDETVPWEDRRRCVRSIHVLFEQCFARRCDRHLSHLDRAGSQTNPLNTACYMWWEFVPRPGDGLDPAHGEYTAECLDVMRRTLELDCEACQESALHGLGHKHLDFGHWRDEDDPQYGVVAEVAETVAIINDFLARHPDLSPDLRDYALAARGGRIQ